MGAGPDPTTTISNGVVTTNVNFPAWTWIALFVGFGLAMVCIFKPKASPFLAPLYAVAEGVFLGVISKAFESQWDGIVFQAILATIAVFFATLALYVSGVVKVTRKFKMVVIGATAGVFVLYFGTFLLSLFGADISFLNSPSPLGIGISVVICVIASLNLFLDYEFIARRRRAAHRSTWSGTARSGSWSRWCGCTSRSCACSPSSAAELRAPERAGQRPKCAIRTPRPRVLKKRLKPTYAGEADESIPSVGMPTACTANT